MESQTDWRVQPVQDLTRTETKPLTLIWETIQSQLISKMADLSSWSFCVFGNQKTKKTRKRMVFYKQHPLSSKDHVYLEEDFFLFTQCLLVFFFSYILQTVSWAEQNLLTHWNTARKLGIQPVYWLTRTESGLWTSLSLSQACNPPTLWLRHQNKVCVIIIITGSNQKMMLQASRWP